MQYGTALTWGLFMYSGCACVMFVLRDKNKTKQKNEKKKNTKKHKNKHVSSAKDNVRSSVVQVTFLPASSLVQLERDFVPKIARLSRCSAAKRTVMRNRRRVQKILSKWLASARVRRRSAVDKKRAKYASHARSRVKANGLI